MYEDKIIIDRLKVFANHGVFDEEKKNGQFFYVSCIVYTDTKLASKSDDLSKTVNYGELAVFIDKWMKDNTVDLIETVANELAWQILKSFPVKTIEIRIDKPSAPIELEFESVAVQIKRGWHQAYLSVGSNMGDKKAFIEEAIKSLENSQEIKDVKVSDFLETKPYGYTNQDSFINAAIAIKTMLSPEELLDFLHEIEQAAGRQRKIHWGPRTLDLDILLYDDLIYESDVLVIPHVDMENREFVLRPMCDIAPNLRHPILQKTMSQLLRGVSNEY